MRILFVTASTEFSIGDVSRGYRTALQRQGHELADYVMSARISYHLKSIPKELQTDPALVAKVSSENIICEALYHRAELVVIISGLNVHPVALWLLAQVKIPVAVVLTESPYDDKEQSQWIDMTSAEDGTKLDVTVFTNDAYSAKKRGWSLLAPSFDPAIHKPMPPDPDGDCDVLMIGTGWPERQAFLECVDWTGINLKIYGVWPGILENPDSPLHRFFHPMIVDNYRVAGLYGAAKINLNFHRTSKVAETPGPRVYELAACGAFQISDHRKGLGSLFGASIPTYQTAQELENLIRYYLKHPDVRFQLAARARELAENETFDNRVSTMMVAIAQKEQSNAINSR